MTPPSAARPGRVHPGLVVALLVAAPALVGLGYAAAAAVDLVGFAPHGPSLARPLRVLGERAVWRSVGFTLWIAAASTLLAGAAAVLIAVVFRGTGRADRVARALAVLPLPLPHLVAAVGAVLVLGQSGLLARLAHALGLVAVPAGFPALVYDRWGTGLILALAWKEAPFLTLLAVSVLATRGAALEETARTLGAGALARFGRVTWPLLWRGLLPGLAAVFAFVAGSWETAVLLAPSDPLALPLLTAERYADAALAARGDAFVLVLLALALSLAAVALHERARARREGDQEAELEGAQAGDRV